MYITGHSRYVLKGIGKYLSSCSGPAVWLGLLFFCAGSCTARLDITTTASGQRPVIYGTVTNEYTHQTVTVSSSEGYFSGSSSGTLRGAVITLRAGSRIYDYVELAEQEGSYITSEPLAGVEGQEYILTVEVDVDGDGMPEVYRAGSVMPPPVTIDSITVRKSTTITDRYEVLFWGEVPYDKGYYLSFYVSRDRTPFTDSLSKYRIIEDRYFGTGRIEGLPCYFLSRESGDNLMEGDIVGMKIDVLPGGYGKFLSDAQSELTGSIPLFSGPPANLETNIMQVSGSLAGEPLGFFGTVASATAYTFFRREEESVSGYGHGQ